MGSRGKAHQHLVPFMGWAPTLKKTGVRRGGLEVKAPFALCFLHHVHLCSAKNNSLCFAKLDQSGIKLLQIKLVTHLPPWIFSPEAESTSVHIVLKKFALHYGKI